MAYPVPTTRSWSWLDSNSFARNWIQDSSGAHIEQDAQASAGMALADRINHCLSRQPHVVIAKVWPAANIPTANSYLPLAVWPDQHRVDNAWQYRVSVASAPRLINSAVAPAVGRYAGSEAEIATQANITATAVNSYFDTVESEYTKDGVAPDGVESLDGISTLGAMSPYCFVVQFKELSQLWPGTHLYAQPFLAKKGETIRADAVEDLRTVMDRMRRTVLPQTGWWVAQGVEASPTPPGDHTGIAISNTVRVNLFDVSVNTRNATTPGTTFYGYRQGVGREDQDYGKRFPIACRVYARSVNADVNLRFEGPDHVADNETNVTITGDGVARMYNADGIIWGNPMANENCANSERNKIDYFSEGVEGGGTVYIYGVYTYSNDPMPYV